MARRAVAGERELRFRLTDEEREAVAEVARRVRIPVAGAARLLLLRGLDREVVDPTASHRRRAAHDERGADRQVMLAALLAAEHTLLMLSQQISGGAERAAALEEAAAAAAQRRLARVARAEGVETGARRKEAAG